MSSLQIFSGLDVLEDHRKVCLEINDKQRIKIPGKRSILSLIRIRDN